MQGRRQFLRLLGAGAAGAGAVATGMQLGRGEDSSEPTSGPPSTPAQKDIAATPQPGPTTTSRHHRPNDHALIVIELKGGNDGLSTLVPATDDRYRSWRRTTGFQPDELVGLGDGLGLHPNLAPLHERGLAVLAGVGTRNPDLSHFEMSRRWAQGDSAGDSTHRNGFLGACCDHLEGQEAITGVSIGWGSVKFMESTTATTMTLPDLDRLEAMTREDSSAAEFRRGLRHMAQGPAVPPLDWTRQGLLDALDFGDVVRVMPDRSDAYPDDDFAQRLATAARLLRSGAGLRVVHVPLGDFDTHEGHRWRHDELMRELGDGVAALLDDLDGGGLGDKVLVATVSEFGRRPQENGWGTDHGAASVALLAGPVRPGIHGDLSPLNDLDEYDNLRTTVDMQRYYATLAEGWLGLDAREFFDKSQRPIENLLRT